MTYFGSAGLPANFLFAMDARVSFFIFSVVVVVVKTVSVFILVVVVVTADATHIGIFFGSSVNMRRHLNRNRELILLMAKPVIRQLVLLTVDIVHDLCSYSRRHCKDHTCQQYTVAADQLFLECSLD